MRVVQVTRTDQPGMFLFESWDADNRADWEHDHLTYLDCVERVTDLVAEHDPRLVEHGIGQLGEVIGGTIAGLNLPGARAHTARWEPSR